MAILSKSTVNGKSKSKRIRFEFELLEEIEARTANFSGWVKQACKEKLAREKNEVIDNGSND